MPPLAEHERLGHSCSFTPFRTCHACITELLTTDEQKWPGVRVELRKWAVFGLRQFDFDRTGFEVEDHPFCVVLAEVEACAAQTKSGHVFDFLVSESVAEVEVTKCWLILGLWLHT
jgi:hypothetical protein